MTTKMLVIENQEYARFFVDLQDICRAVAYVVIFQNQSALNFRREPAVSRRPVRPTSRQIADALAHQVGIGAVQDDELRRVKRKPQIQRAGAASECVQLARALFDLPMKLRHFGMRHIRRKVGRDPVHPNFFRRKIIENAFQILERDAKVRGLLPTPAIVALQVLRAQDLDRETKSER